MNKFLITLYLVVFSTYVLFTREPDFFGSEKTNATIHFIKDSTGNTAPFAVYPMGKQIFKTDARYLLRPLTEGDKVQIIFTPDEPTKNAVYSWWGYWVTWQELLGSITLLIVLFQIAKAITKNPTPEGLLSELEDTVPKRKRRYS
jgi:hypothetical protein